MFSEITFKWTKEVAREGLEGTGRWSAVSLCLTYSTQRAHLLPRHAEPPNYTLTTFSFLPHCSGSTTHWPQNPYSGVLHVSQGQRSSCPPSHGSTRLLLVLDPISGHRTGCQTQIESWACWTLPQPHLRKLLPECWHQAPKQSCFVTVSSYCCCHF